jgi:predicted RNA binding protein YcfA (HicA-like mRNA interferase family)
LTPPLPLVQARVVIKAVERKGFRLKNRRGSHCVYKHADGRRTTIVDHGSKLVDRSILKRVIADTGITLEDIADAK